MSWVTIAFHPDVAVLWSLEIPLFLKQPATIETLMWKLLIIISINFFAVNQFLCAICIFFRGFQQLWNFFNSESFSIYSSSLLSLSLSPSLPPFFSPSLSKEPGRQPSDPSSSSSSREGPPAVYHSSNGRKEGRRPSSSNSFYQRNEVTRRMLIKITLWQLNSFVQYKYN